MRAQWNFHNKYFAFVFRLVGLWPEETYKFDLYTIYASIVFGVFICGHNFFQTMTIFFVDDLNQASAVVFLILSLLMIINKFYVFVIKIETIKRLMSDIKKEVFLPKNKRQEEQGNSSRKVWENLFYLFVGMAGLTVSSWLLIPIVNGTYKEYKLPLLAWYPFDYKKPFLYEMTYIHQSLGLIYLAIVSVNIDCVIAALMTFVAIQCDVLCDNLKNLRANDNVSEDFLECVEHHKEILRFAQDANKFFDFLIFIQFFATSVSVGFTMFQLTLVKPFSSDFYTFVVYGSTITEQIFMYCWLGNEVLFKSANIPMAAYESDWTNIPVELKKKVMFFILRTQKPIVFTAVGLFPLSLETFIGIMRTAWSYFAILNNINTS